jgi:hypothetical protein
VKKEVPTLKNVLLTLKKEIKFPGGKEFFRRVLKKIVVLNSKSAKNRRSFLMENTAAAT